MKKSTWKSEAGYIWSLVGSAVGFANLLGFGSQCYRNGGGAFLIPFFFAMFVLGIPMLCLEGVVGKRLGLPLVSAYGRVLGQRGKALGWMAIMAVTTIGAFYTVLTGWTLAYTWYSATGQLAQVDLAGFFSNEFLGDSGSLNQWGTLSIPIAASTLFCSIFAYYVISQNIRSGIEKWCSIFLPMLLAIVLLLAGVVTLLPGATTGFVHYLAPDFSKLFDIKVWRDVFGHLFFSFSLGLGIVVGYSRHTDQNANIGKAMLRVAIADFVISFLAGLVIFGCIGFMAAKDGQPFETMVHNTSIFDMGYVVFPWIIQSFGGVTAQAVGALFFFCLFIAGITGVFSIVESVAGNLEVEFGLARRGAVAIAISLIFLLCLPFCMGNSTYVIDALAPMVLGYNMLIGGIAQILVFMYGSKEIQDAPVWFKRARRSLNYFALKYIALAILVSILVTSLAAEFSGGLRLPEMVRWSWFVGACLFSLALSWKRAPEYKKTWVQ